MNFSPEGEWDPPSPLTRGAVQSGLRFRKTTVGTIPFLRGAYIGMVSYRIRLLQEWCGHLVVALIRLWWEQMQVRMP